MNQTKIRGELQKGTNSKKEIAKIHNALIAIEDATGTIIGAYFDYQEALNGYYNILHQILTSYGLPYISFTNRCTVFEYKQKKNPLLLKRIHSLNSVMHVTNSELRLKPAV